MPIELSLAVLKLEILLLAFAAIGWHKIYQCRVFRWLLSKLF